MGLCWSWSNFIDITFIGHIVFSTFLVSLYLFQTHFQTYSTPSKGPILEDRVILAEGFKTWSFWHLASQAIAPIQTTHTHSFFSIWFWFLLFLFLFFALAPLKFYVLETCWSHYLHTIHLKQPLGVVSRETKHSWDFLTWNLFIFKLRSDQTSNYIIAGNGRILGV